MTEVESGPDPTVLARDPNEMLSTVPRQPEPPDPLFDEFWSAYPRKVGKGAARQAWQRMHRRGVDAREISAAAKRFGRRCGASGTDLKYIPHPAKWLNDERYADEAPEASAVPVIISGAPARRLNGEQILAAVIRLAADQERPVTAANEIMRLVWQHAPYDAAEPFPAVTDERVEELAAMPYAEYLQTPEWRERRKVMLGRADRRCQVCNGADRLHVHHRTYERRGNEQPGDLTVLCEGCHKLFHDNGKLTTSPAA